MIIFQYTHFCKTARKEMKSKNLSYRNLSQLTRIPLATLHRLLKNSAHITISDFIVISRELDMNVYEFFDDQETQMEVFR